MASADDIERLEKYVTYCIDDALNGGEYDPEVHIIDVFTALVSIRCDDEPMVVAVNSYLGCAIDSDEALDLVEDYLVETEWCTSDEFDDLINANKVRVYT